jgi:ferredoxin--NADP+ reductase
MSPRLKVAIIGAGPAGIYAGNILANSVKSAGGEVAIDLIESLPAPYGLIRYGVAPDHPRIKGIVNSLHEMLNSGAIRFIGNVTFGRDVTLPDLERRYDAVIIATGAIRDVRLDLPGIDLPGSYGAADFVSWFDGHPDVPRAWPLDATDVAVLGNGNVALDVARMLAKHVEDLMPTDIPANVAAGLAGSAVTDVHVFGRRGPGDIKFTPIELRELGEVPDVDVIVYPEDFDDDADTAATGSNQLKVMSRTLRGWLDRDPTGASRRLHLHFAHAPIEIVGDERVEGIRFARTIRADDGRYESTGEIIEYPVQAVYRAVGYFGSPLPGVPFDDTRGVIPNVEGRVITPDGTPIAGLYATGWVKRGPVGLIGHTKGDAAETVAHLLADIGAMRRADDSDLLDLLESREIEYTSWEGWLQLDAHERGLGDADESPVTRERVKVVGRVEQVVISREVAAVAR